MSANLQMYHCRKCGKAMFKAKLVPGTIIEKKCERCDEMNMITLEASSDLVSDGTGGYRPAPSKSQNSPQIVPTAGIVVST